MSLIDAAIYTANLVVGDNGETCPYPWHLGTDPFVMMRCVEEIYHKYKLVPARIRRIDVSRGGKPELIFAGAWAVADPAKH